MRRHFEAAEFEQSQAPGWSVGRIELVDRKLRAMSVSGKVGQQMAQRSIDQPRQRLVLLELVLARQLLKGDLQLIKAIVPCLVDARRLAGRADDHARKQIRQRRMVLAVGDEAQQ